MISQVSRNSMPQPHVGSTCQSRAVPEANASWFQMNHHPKHMSHDSQEMTTELLQGEHNAVNPVKLKLHDIIS